MILWFDCETTGLDESKCSILEVATILTDDKLNEASRFESVIGIDPSVVGQMDSWAKAQHTSSGLLNLCGASRVTVEEVESQIITQISRVQNGLTKPVLAGSSIHFDRKFIRQYMPTLDQALHYRMLDVSAYLIGLEKVLDVKWPPQSSGHRAMADIESSLRNFKTIIGRFK